MNEKKNDQPVKMTNCSIERNQLTLPEMKQINGGDGEVQSESDSFGGSGSEKKNN